MIIRKVLTVVVLVCLSASAQEFRGKITGRVLDSTGAVIPGVRVVAINADTKVTMSAASNEQGNYEVLFLVPGTYALNAERKGFKKYVRTDVQVRIEAVVPIDITLEAGTIVETVTVTGEQPLLDLSTASGQSFDNRILTTMPLPSQNPWTVFQLSSDLIGFGAPAHSSAPPSVEVATNVGGGGSRNYSMEFTIDGAPSMWKSYASFTPMAEMVSEIKVQTGKFDASVGHAPAGSINVALRSGSNAWHGSLTERYNGNRLQGLDFFQRKYSSSSTTRHQVVNNFRATASGPVRIPGLYNGANRTFWIYGFEGHLSHRPESGSYLFTVPTLKERGGDFSELLPLGSTYQIYDPATIASAGSGRFSRLPLANNIIPASRMNPIALRLLEYYPNPNVTGTTDGRNNYFQVYMGPSDHYSHMTRLDHNVSEKHRIFGRYQQWHQLWSSYQYFPNISQGQGRDRWNKGVGFDYVYIINPQFLANFRYSVSRFTEATTPFGAGFDLASVGFPQDLVSRIDPQARTFPKITISGLTTLGVRQPTKEPTLYHSWAADFTRMKGNHSVRFGAEFRLYREHMYNFTDTTPTMDFATTWTRGPLDNSGAAPIGQGLASFLLGLPTGGSANIRASYAEQSSYTALFVQDDFKVSPRLTINVGLRYEYEAPTTERFNRSVRAFDFTTSSPIEAAAKSAYAAKPIAELPAAQFRAVGGVLFAGVGDQPQSLWKPDWKNLAPRIGFAYQLPRAAVLRAGYGVHFAPLGVDRGGDVSQTGFTRATSLVPSLNNGLDFVATLSNPFPDGFLTPLGAAGGLSTNLGSSVGFFAENRPHPYLQRWMLSLQKQLGESLLVEAGYTGTRSIRLGVSRQLDAVPGQYYSTLPYRDTTTINLLSAAVSNPFYPLLAGTGLAGSTVTRAQLLRPYPHFTSITANEPIGYSWYHAAHLRVERRMRSGFSVQAGYTWSKYMEATGFLNDFDTMPEKVISDQDRPHRLVVSGMWELPFGRGRQFASGWKGLPGQLVSGWEIQAIYQGQSGQALGFGNVFFNGDVHTIPLPRDQRSVNRWFNTDAGFEKSSAKQPSYNVRTLPSRFTGLRGPGLNIWNVSIGKNFRISEQARLELRAEALNALCHTHFTTPNSNPTSTLFGTISSAVGYPRVTYLAAKLQF